jgi:opacity protein-like surface antigen
MNPMKIIRFLAISGTLALLMLSPVFAGDPLDPKNHIIESPVESGSDWSFEFVPYMWAGSIKGDVGYKGFITDVDLSPGDVLENLDFVASGAFGMEYQKWGLILEGLYVEVSDDVPFTSGPASALFKKADLSSTIGVGNILGTYKLIDNDRGYQMRLYGGARVNYAKTEIHLQQNLAPSDLDRSRSDTWWDGIVGFKVQIPLGDRFFTRYLAEIGGGSSDLTWEAMALLGYKLTDHVDVRLAYRYLSVDYEKGDKDFVYDTDLGGIMLGVGYSW